MKVPRRNQIVVASLVVLTTWLVPTVATSAATSKQAGDVTFRAVLCFAPLQGKPAFSAQAALPSCQARFRLTAKNDGVSPDNSASGFSSKTVKPDPRFLKFPDSTFTVVELKSDLLLSGIKGNQSQRFFVGPAGLTASSIKSAKAVKQSLGQWVVEYQLTKAGSTTWNKFAKRQFHAYIAIVANGEVYSAPLIEPGQTHFTSFGDSGEVSGAFTKALAKSLAEQMQPK
jgi:SecD-like export protein